MIKLHGHEISGNSYKVKLLLELLKIEYEWIKVDLMKSEQKSPEYLCLGLALILISIEPPKNQNIF